MISKKIKAFLVGFSVMLVSSCSVEDGKNGENGVGFNELSKFGSINMTFSGTRPDNVPFTNTTAFKFTSVEGSDYSNSNSVVANGDDLNFNVLRYLSTPDDVFQESTASFQLNVIDVGLSTQTIILDFFRIDNFAVIGSDLKYFVLSDNYNTDSITSGISNLDIANYSFDDVTNVLKFRFSFTVEGSNNDSGNEMNVIGDVTVTVLEEL